VNAERRRYEWELTVRRPFSPEHAAERAHRGAQLCRDVLAGVAAIGPSTPAQDTTTAPPRVEYVACAGCYKPICATPGERCPDCGDQRTGDPE
jgi:hypothetical protein